MEAFIEKRKKSKQHETKTSVLHTPGMSSWPFFRPFICFASPHFIPGAARVGIAGGCLPRRRHRPGSLEELERGGGEPKVAGNHTVTLVEVHGTSWNLIRDDRGKQLTLG